MPFPAVTMNAPVLSHPNRLIEAVYNNIQFDCSKFKPKQGSETCQKCMEETRKVREDLLPFTKLMIQDQAEKYSYECRREVPNSGDKTAAYNSIKRRIVKIGCSRDKEVLKYAFASKRAVTTLLPCFSNLTSGKIPPERVSDMVEAIAKTLRVPECHVSDAFGDFRSLCSEFPRVRRCFFASFDDIIHASATCNAFGLFSSAVPQSGELFRPGVILKHANQRMQTPAADLLRLLKGPILDDQTHSCLLDNFVGNYSADCDLEKQMDLLVANIKTIYKLYRQFVPPTSKFPNEISETADIEIIRNTVQNEYQYNLNNESHLNDFAPMLACKNGNMTLSTKCDLFHSTFSTSGIGYSFNNEPFSVLFKNTSSNFAFYKEMYEKEDNDENDIPRHIVGTGQRFSLDFIIRHDPYGYRYNGDNKPVEYQQVYMALHDPIDIPDLKSEGIIIQPGLSYEIRVSPTLTVTDSSGLAMKPETRNCYTKNDNDGLKVHNIYSQSACLFECKLKNAARLCKCSAWDYPRIEPSTDICLNKTMAQCFQDIMANDIYGSDCDCLNDCEHVTYNMDLHVSSLRNTGFEDNLK